MRSFTGRLVSLLALLALLHLAFATAPPLPNFVPPNVFDVRDFGAVGDGVTMNTLPFSKVHVPSYCIANILSCDNFMQAVAAAASNYAQRGCCSASVVSVSAGVYLTGQIALQVRSCY